MDADAQDAEWMVAAAAGDRAAFARLFDRHQAPLRRFCLRFVGIPARADELAQDVFVKAFRGASSWAPGATVRSWLYRVATNHCLNEVRRSRGAVAERPADEEQLAAPQSAADDPQATAEARQLEAEVGRALAALSPRERAAFCMARFDGLPYRDIAAALGASEPAVKSLIHRATVAVAHHLEAAGCLTSSPGRSAA